MSVRNFRSANFEPASFVPQYSGPQVSRLGIFLVLCICFILVPFWRRNNYSPLQKFYICLRRKYNNWKCCALWSDVRLFKISIQKIQLKIWQEKNINNNKITDKIYLAIVTGIFWFVFCVERYPIQIRPFLK